MTAIALLAFLVGCGDGGRARDAEKQVAVEKNAALRREIESLLEEKSQKEAREAALMEQLEDEAAQKVELSKELERVRPMVDRVEEAERRAAEIEEMLKEVKKLE